MKTHLHLILIGLALATAACAEDTINGKPILVTYCPLCGTAMIFDRKVGGKVRSFGISGLLYQSDVLMYDREDESLWSQLGMKAVSGPLSGTAKDGKELPTVTLFWFAWQAFNPQTTLWLP